MFSIWETIFETWEWKEELIEGFGKEMFGVKYKEKEAGLQKKDRAVKILEHKRERARGI